ncbi:MAG: helix-turn-helix domain-containing protein [Adlercreutzia equolifaciens]
MSVRKFDAGCERRRRVWPHGARGGGAPDAREGPFQIDIAETLFISENTVRSHSKHIYQKLGVHPKQEVLDLLGLD